MSPNIEMVKFYIKFIFLAIALSLIFACQSSQKTDLRTLAPAETLVYLETDDLGEMLQALTQAKSFQELTKSTPSFYALNKTQVAVVVTGFETSEKQVTNESAILNFKPRFVLIADTHAWESTTISLVENQIESEIKKRYGDDVKLDKGDINGVKFFNWTSKKGEKIFANVSGSMIFIGNDESIIEKCLAVKRGEADNLLKNKEFESAYERSKGDKNIAFGYVSADGIAQIANLAGVSAAIDSSEEDVVRSFIAKNVPILVQKTTKEIVWTAKKSERGIEDKLLIKTDAEVGSVWKETLFGVNSAAFESVKLIPNDFNSFTRYTLQNPQIAWRSVLLTSSKQIDVMSGSVLNELSGSFFEPYGIADVETFLSGIEGEIVTVRLDDEGDETAVIAEVKDLAKVKSSISEQINFKIQPEKTNNAEIWKSLDKSLAAALIENRLVIGETESVLKCLQASLSGQNFSQSQFANVFSNNISLAKTIVKDTETASKIVGILGDPKEGNNKIESFYTTETSFAKDEIERKTISDFGLIGMLIEQFDSED